MLWEIEELDKISQSKPEEIKYALYKFFDDNPEIKRAVDGIIDNLDLKHLEKRQIFCVRSQGSKARAYARIWGLSRIFQITAGYKPTYVLIIPR